MPKQILLFMTVSILLTSLVFPYWNVKAAVPVEVVQFGAGTEYEESLEKFMFNLFSALQTRDQNFTAAFELQKIEKAREDVNKLVYETQKELIDSGTSVTFTDPITNAAYIIKNGSRIIHNIDDFLYEGPIQKGRDFIYCFFGGDLEDKNGDGVPGPPKPWKIFPFGDTENESLRLQKSLRDKLLTRIQRKAKYKLTAPPQTWYTQELCNRILTSFPVTSECFEEPTSAECPTKAMKNYYPTLTKSLSAYKKDRGYFTIDEMTEAILNPNNTYQGTYDYVSKQVETIIGEYAGLRYAEYIAGQGIQPERVLLESKDPVTNKWYHFDTDYIISPAIMLLQKMQAATQAQFDLAQKAYLNMPWYLASDSTLADYNLKKVSSQSVFNNDGTAIGTFLPHVAPNIPANILDTGTLEFKSITGSTLWSGLPAPWEDEYRYTKLPQPAPGALPGDPLYFDQYNPTDYLQPPPGIPPDQLEEPGYIGVIAGGTQKVAERPMYRWFKDVLEIYDYGRDLPNINIGEKHIGWENLLKKWFFPMGAY